MNLNLANEIMQIEQLLCDKYGWTAAQAVPQPHPDLLGTVLRWQSPCGNYSVALRDRRGELFITNWKLGQMVARISREENVSGAAGYTLKSSMRYFGLTCDSNPAKILESQFFQLGIPVKTISGAEQ